MSALPHLRLVSRRLVPSVGLVIVSTCLIAPSQQSSPPVTQPEGTEINAQSSAIWITARNRDGTTAELSPSDLQVKIDGKRTSVRAIRRVNPALRYCILHDTSGSTRAALAAQRDEVTALLSKIPQAGRDYGLLVAFAYQAFIDAEGTDPQKIAKAFHQEARGGTALYDAMIACSDDLSKNDIPQSARETLRLIFIFSDGEDNASHVSRDAAERAVISARIRVYAIGEKDTGGPSSSEADRGIQTLKRLSEISGGKHYSPGEKMHTEQIMADISGDLASLYAVMLTPEGTLSGDRFYKLEIKCDEKNITVTAPRQYFAPSQ